MSNWGDDRTINGCKFVPHVNSPMWQEMTRSHYIGTVLYLGGGDDSKRVKMYQEVIKDRYTGQNYGCWLDGSCDPHWMLGDILETTFRYTGVKALTNIYKRATGKDCGCRRRQNICNQWHEIARWYIARQFRQGEQHA